MNRVVITGMGVVAPNGIGINDFNNALKKGVSGLRFQNDLSELGFNCTVAGIPDLQPEHFDKLPKRLINKMMSNQLLYGLIAADEAWRDAKLNVNNETDYEAASYMGQTCSNLDLIEILIDKINKKSIRELPARIIEQSISSSLTSYVSGYLGLGGAFSNSSACATGTESILNGYYKVRNNEFTKIIAGSSEGSNPYLWGGFDRIRALSKDFNKTPTSASRPMDKDSSGFIPGAGAGALVLESLDSALERNAEIYGEVIGGYSNCGGQRSGGTMTKPNPDGMLRCIKRALEDSGVDPKEIDYISGHLTGTMADTTEVATWARALKRKPEEFPYLNSLKSLVGHTLGASGSIECIATLLQIKNGYIHENKNLDSLNPNILNYISEDKVPTRKTNKDINVAIKSSFGFGDINCCIIFKKFKNYGE